MGMGRVIDVITVDLTVQLYT